jgi:hypothetical protein
MLNVVHVVRMAALGLSLLAGVSFLAPAAAQPVTGHIIDRITVSRHAGCFLVNITLNFPMQYISHFPAKVSDQLRIRLKPAVTDTADLETFNTRESARPNYIHGSPLMYVSYERENTEPYLILQFTDPVAYTLAQGDDFRSMLIQIRSPEADEGQTCDPFTTPVN